MATEYISNAILRSKTLENKWVSLLPNVKDTAKVPTFNGTGLTGADTCDFTETGDFNLGEVEIAVKSFSIQIKVCKSDLEQWWTAEQLLSGANNTDIPADLNSYTVQYLEQYTNADVEKAIWRANTAGATGEYLLDQLDGINKQAKASTLAFTGVALTESNILAKMKEAYMKIPAAIMDNVAFYVSQKTASLYIGANAALPQGIYTQEGKLVFFGKEIRVVPMADDEITVLDPKNAWVATDAEGDKNEVGVYDESAYSKNKIYILRYKLGIKIGKVNEVIHYSVA